MRYFKTRELTRYFPGPQHPFWELLPDQKKKVFFRNIYVPRSFEITNMSHFVINDIGTSTATVTVRLSFVYGADFWLTNIANLQTTLVQFIPETCRLGFD